MLKEIGVQLLLLQRLVGQDIIGKLLDFQRDPLFRQNGLGLLQQLAVRRRAGSHLQRHSLAGVSVVSLLGLSLFFLLLGTGRQAKSQAGRRGQRRRFFPKIRFHRVSLHLWLYFSV
jgi:hypothetical protein